MPIRQPRRACLPLKTGQLTQYSSELDDGYYQKGVAKSYTINTAGAQSGTTNIDLPHLINTGISFDAASKEIRCTGACGVFKATGGEVVVVSGASQAANNAAWTTASATADKVVLTTTPTDESAGASITIAKRQAISNNTVIDNNTGLEWVRYPTTAMGTLGTGNMPWTGVIYDIFAYCAVCNTANLGGHNDWRIPNIFELYSLVDCEAPNANMNSTAFPTADRDYWSSSTKPDATTNAWNIYFTSGYVWYAGKTLSKMVMLVRGG